MPTGTLSVDANTGTDRTLAENEIVELRPGQGHALEFQFLFSHKLALLCGLPPRAVEHESNDGHTDAAR
jgi:hypothetical protein